MNKHSEPFDIDKFLDKALAAVDEMVASGKMPKEQANGIRERAPLVRKSCMVGGPKDWVDSFISSCERNIQKSALPEPEKKRLIAEGREPQFVATLRLYGPPEWLGVKSEVGEHGKYISDLPSSDLQFLQSREREARSAMDEFAAQLGVDVDRKSTPGEMDTESTVIASTMLDACEKFGKSPESAREFMEACELQAMSQSMANRDLTVRLLGDDCAHQSMRCEAVWAKSGFPFVHIRDAAWAASLGATSVPADLAAHIRPPWPAFRLAVPQGLLSIDLDEGGEGHEDCTRLMVMVDAANEWTIVLYGARKMMHVTGESAARLCENVSVKRRIISDDPGLRLTGRDGRVMRVASRLVLAVCMSMDGDSGRPLEKRRRLGKKRRSPGPLVRQYLLRPPVQVGVDARSAVRAYVAGSRRSSPSVQSLIRGHWKYQRCGPGGKDRKFMHIEPYWRGPEDAPIAVRPHILKGPRDGAQATE